MTTPTFPPSSSSSSSSTPTPPTPLLPSLTDTHSRPSLFELIAQDQLRDLLHPVFRYVLTYFAQRYPRHLLRLLNHHEEIFALLLLVVERHHLIKHNASLSEHFYHLTTTPLTLPTPRLDAHTRSIPSTRHPIHTRARPQLSPKQRWGLLFVLVGIPYIRARAQDLYERVSTVDEIDGPSNTQIQSLPIRIFKRVYPYANLTFDSVLLAYDVGYLFGGRYRPWHGWLRVQIQRRNSDGDDEDSGKSWANLPSLLPPLLLTLKLAQWWYSPSSPRALPSTTSTPVHTAIQPPRPLPIQPTAPLTPPTSPRPHASELPGFTKDEKASAEERATTRSAYVIGPKAFGKCPVCKNKWRNPAVLPTGWVMCWRCAWDAVAGDDDDIDDKRDDGDKALDIEGDAEKDGDDEPQITSKGRCPITRVPVRPDEIRRVLV